MDIIRQGHTVLKDQGAMADWIGKSVRGFISQVTSEEARRQMRIGNDPTLVSVDNQNARAPDRAMLGAFEIGKPVVDTSKMRRIVTLTFADLSELYHATKYAYTLAESKLRRKTGAAARSVYFWMQDPGNKARSAKAHSLSEVKAWLNNAGDPLTSIHILGPTVSYRRKLIYNPKGRQYRSFQSAGRARGRIGFTSGEIEVKATRRSLRYRVADSYLKAVAAAVRRRYPGIYCAYSFVPSAEPLDYGKFIPRLWLGVARGSRMRRIPRTRA